MSVILEVVIGDYFIRVVDLCKLIRDLVDDYI
jgi:hypothetical protein